MNWCRLRGTSEVIRNIHSLEIKESQIDHFSLPTFITTRSEYCFNNAGKMSVTLTKTGLTENVLGYKPPHPPVAPFEPDKDRASFADPEKKSLLSAAAKIRHLTPFIGTELVGVQLNKLNSEQRDELALLAAEVNMADFVCWVLC